MGDGFQLHDGKFLVDPAGFAVHPDCCCGFACATCTGDVPYRIKAVFAGITACPGCRTMNALGGGGAHDGDDYKVEWVWPGGTVILKNTAACVWTSDLFDIATVRWYDAGCITPFAARTFAGRVWVRVDGFSPYVVLFKGSDASDPDVVGGLYTFNAALAAGPKDCEALGLVADAGTCVPGWRLANSGQVTLSIP